MINLLFIDPHPVVQKGFKNFFKNNNDLRVHKTIGSLQELSKLSSSLNKIDIIVSEIKLKDGDIEDLIKKINKKNKV